MRTVKRSFAMLAAVAALLVLAGAADASVQVGARGMTPRFKAGIHDYTLPNAVCTKRFALSVGAPGATSARIGAGGFLERRGTRRLRLVAGQAVRIAARTGRRAESYWLRCLPKDFPTFAFKRLRRVRTPFFVTSVGHYVMIFDGYGVPVWWYRSRTETLDGKAMPEGLIAYSRYYGGGFGKDRRLAYELRRPSGKLVRVLRAVQAITDHHELQRTPDGNYVLLAYKKRPGTVDLSAYNGDSEATVLDAVIQKLSPSGKRLWSWNSKHHIGLAESREYYEHLEDEPYDIVHPNSIEPLAGGDYLISMRHTDAIYRIDGATGNVEWKLGGTPTPQSLKIVGDRLSHSLSGQHDARMLPDGTITVHDNGTELKRPPRALRFRIAGRTAFLLDSQADKAAPGSFCCGSARFAEGAWLMSWGGTPLVTEFFRGRRTFSLKFLEKERFSYRANPVQGETSLARLRRGMNLRYPTKR